MSYQSNSITSHYRDLNDEPVTHQLAPIFVHQDISQTSLEQAIELVSHFFIDIETYVQIAKENSKNPADGLSQDESACIQLYTMEFDSGPSLYEVFNKALRDITRQSLKPWSHFLKLFLTAIDKLPSCAQTVWRVVNEEDLSSKYLTGSRFAWWGVTSCTTDMQVLESENYLGRTGQRTLFSIECQNGKLIGKHSHFKNLEREVILVPGSYFEVVSQLKLSENLWIIHVKQIEPPVSSLETSLFTSTVMSSDEQKSEQDTSDVNERPLEISTEIETETASTFQREYGFAYYI